MRIGIAGCVGIGLGLAALRAAAGHEPWLWAPRGGEALAAAQGGCRRPA